MPRTATKKEPVLSTGPAEKSLEQGEITSQPPAPVPAEPTSPPKIPAIASPHWQEFVLSQFGPTDRDPEGNPTAEACRIVAANLLGTIVSERVRTIQCPSEENDYRATVEVAVTIAWGNDMSDVREFEDVADVFPGNMDPRYAQFATASAKTKALGRAYKSALMLKRVYTSEELAYKEVPAAGGDFVKLISLSQRRFIDKACRDLDVNVVAFINSGERQYASIIQIPYARADRMIQRLSEFERGEAPIPDIIRGYNANWQKVES